MFGRVLRPPITSCQLQICLSPKARTRYDRKGDRELGQQDVVETVLTKVGWCGLWKLLLRNLEVQFQKRQTWSQTLSHPVKTTAAQDSSKHRIYAKLL
ncbi:hypothetical protein TWF173_011546 [Orbilia oligospora]|nr:hypothetical protein TWF173_011546 [Orbilia oligospora]